MRLHGDRAIDDPGSLSETHLQVRPRTRHGAGRNIGQGLAVNCKCPRRLQGAERQYMFHADHTEKDPIGPGRRLPARAPIQVPVALKHLICERSRVILPQFRLTAA